jgi:hypothetical protein
VVIRESQLVILKRSALPIVIEAELLDFLDRFDALLPQLLRRELSLLMDMREGPMRNEPEYEALHEPCAAADGHWVSAAGGADEVVGGNAASESAAARAWGHCRCAAGVPE